MINTHNSVSGACVPESKPQATRVIQLAASEAHHERKTTALFFAGLLINTAMLVWASGDALTPSQSLTVKHPAIFVPIVVSTSGANNSFTPPS